MSVCGDTDKLRVKSQSSCVAIVSCKIVSSDCLSLSVSHRTVLSVLSALSATRVFFFMSEGAIATCRAGIVFIITQGS